MASIADLFFRALLDDHQLQADAAAAGDKAGATLGTRMGAGMSLKLRAGLAVLSAGTALATAGLAQLDEITAKFTADTGASADEADRARKAILEMSSRNLQPMAEIGNALGKVHTDLGLTGDAAAATAEKFLKFGEVTKRDAAEEVKALREIIDSFGLSAAAIPGIMDKLIASHQKYGGSIADDEAALRSLAPNLKSFNLSIDDGISLLNLFKSAGLDAAIAPRALTSALVKLNGESLPDFLKRLGSITDDSARARLAIEIFGKRAGVQLANAIRPGRDSLADFALSTNDTNNALGDASTAIEGTFGARTQLLIKDFTSKLIELGQNFGPVLLGLSSLASLGGALGLGKFTKEIVQAFANAGSQAMDAFTAAIQTGIGVASNLIAKIVDPTEELLQGPINAAGAKIGAVFGAAITAATRIAQAIGDLFLSLPGVATLRSAIVATSTEIGVLSGTTMGEAAATAFKGALVFGIAGLAAAIVTFGLGPVADKLVGDLEADVHKRISDALTTGTTEAIDDARKRVLQALESAQKAHLSDAVIAYYKDELARLDAFMNANPPTVPAPAFKPTGEKLGPPVPIEIQAKEMADLRDQYLAAGRLAASAFLSAWAKLPIAQRIVGEGHAVRLAAANLALSVADGLRSGRANVDAAVAQLRDDMKNVLSARKEIAHDLGLLFGKTLARGLHDSRTIVKKQAEGTRALIEDELIQTVLAGGTAGKKIMDELQRRLHDKDPDVRNQAKRTKQILDQALKDRSAGKSPGDKIGDDLAADLASKGSIVGRVAYALGVNIAKNIRAGVKGTGYVAPAPPTTGAPAADHRGNYNYQHGTPYVPTNQFAFLHRGEAVLTVPQAEAYRSGAWGVTIESVAVSVDARGASHPAAVGAAVRQGIADAMADVLRSQDARLPVGVRS